MHVFKRGFFALIISIITISLSLTPVQASQVSGPVTSSPLDANWPSAPAIGSETAILIEASTGTILYEKDAHRQMYPASITKILTTLIATEMCELDERVTFTEETLQTIPYDSSRIWVDRGNYMNMEDCLAAILIMSANDVAAGVAEHIGGTLDAFADIMNERAAELGCLNSHFVNAHGYHDPDHYTTAYDMAQIGRAFFENDLLCAYAKERNFKHGPTEGQPKPINEFNTNKLLATREYEYEYLVGSKTGYTSDAGQTLISCAQKDGMKLICVVMKAQKPDQYKDTIALFDFGFSNFTTVNIYENDKTYVTADSSYGMEVTDVLGNSSPLLNMDRDSVIVLPKAVPFSDVTSYLTMADSDASYMATAYYQYGTHDIGSAQIFVNADAIVTIDKPGQLEQTETIVPIEPEPEPEEPIYVNIKDIATFAVPAIIFCAIVFWGYRRFTAHREAHNPSPKRRRRNPILLGLRNLFIGFVRGLQAIVGLIQNKIRSIATRTRYKRRGPSGTMGGSYPARHYHSTVDFNLKNTRKGTTDYTQSPDYKRKNVVFHDINK